ncbi:MAG: hypothetical protein LBU82_03610 [Treponema sp.]|nr:hypothetical protein [Treponema sp.]
MEKIKDANTIRLIERIGEHYRANISNRFLRPIILQLPLDKNTWDQIELFTEKLELFRYQGYHLDELYRQIAASTRFVVAARQTIPTLKSRLSANASGQERVLRDMAANNFVSNLQLFADMLNDLYSFLIEIDIKAAGRSLPVYSQMPEMIDISRQLAGK